jgi:TP901 family phage tail tape measure protein
VSAGGSLVKQIMMSIVADPGNAQETIADLSAQGDKLAEPRTMTLTADGAEAQAGVDDVSEALARYEAAAAEASAASERLAELQASGSAGADELAAAQDKNTEATLRALDAQIRLGQAEIGASAKAKEAADAQEESAAKTDAAGDSAEGAHGKLGLLALGAGAVAIGAIDMGMKFQEASTQLVTGAGESKSALDKVEQGMLSISTQTATSSEQIESGMYMIESAGYHGAAGLTVLQAAAEGAKVGNADLGTVADAVTTVLTDYKMKAGDAAEATSGLIATVADGKTHLSDLASSLSKVLPTASALHIAFPQVAGAMATMTSEGVTARLAATHLNSTLLAMANPSKTAAAAMEGVGLSSTKVANTLSHGGLVAALQMVTDAAAKKFPVGSAAYVAAVDKMLGGQAGLSTALELTGKHLGTLKGDTDSVSESMRKGGKDVKGWGDVQHDASFKVEQAKTAAENLGTSIGLDLLPAVIKILTPIDSFAEHIAESKGEAEALAGVVGGALALYVGVKAAGAFKTLASTAGEVYRGFQQIGSGIGTLIGKLTGASGETEALAAATEEQAGATEEATVAQGELDAAMDANPIGAIILALTVLTGIVVAVVGHWKDFEKWGKEAFHDVEHYAEEAFDWVKGHWPLILAILTGPIGLAVLEIKKHWKDIEKGAEDMFHDIEHFFEELPKDILHWVSDFGTLLYDAGKDLIEGLIHGIEDMVGDAEHAAESVGKSILSGVKDVLGIFSPSREAYAVGEFFVQGLQGGMLDGIPAIMGASHQLAQATMAGFPGGSSGAAPGAAGSYGGGNTTIHLTVNGFVGNESQLANQIITVLNTHARRNGNVMPLKGITPR